MKRLLESGSELEVMLLRSAKSETPSRARMRRAIAAASAVAIGSCAATKGNALVGTKTSAWWAAIMVTIGMVVAGGSVVASSARSVPMARPAVRTPSPRWIEVLATRRAAVFELPPDPSPPPPRTVVVPPPARVARVAVEDELTLLRQAKASLAALDPRGALDKLDAHATAYPHGRFAEEAAVLRIEALAASGDEARAEGAAKAFLERRPESPYAQRVRRVHDGVAR